MRSLFSVVLITFLHSIAFAQSNPALSALFDKESNTVKLRWQHTDERVTSYIIQRSSDNTFFTDVYTKRTSDISPDDIIKYTDEKITAGKNYYRLKISRGGSLYESTLPVMIVSGNTENSWVIYPVPVVSLLNLQYTGSGAIKGVITVVIQSVASGTVFTRLRLASTNRNIQIPVSNIGKGIYDIHIYIGDDIAWNQRFVK